MSTVTFLTNEDNTRLENKIEEKTKTIYINQEGYGLNIDDNTTYNLNTIWDDVSNNYRKYMFKLVYGNSYCAPCSVRNSGNSLYLVCTVDVYTNGYNYDTVVGLFSGLWNSADTHMQWTWYDIISQPCLIEGTPINMADGTTKPVEDVKTGDIVQSYNPVTGENTPSVVLLSYITGREHKFTSYSFSNGKHLTIYGMHGIYNKRTGITKDIRNINKNDQIISMSGDTVQWITSSEFMIVGEKKARYNIVTSNNLYYANGILLGQKPFSKMQLVNDLNIPLSDEIRKVWQQDVDDYNSYSSFLNDPNYHAEVAEAYNKLTKAEHHIKVNKQRLLDSDYWVQKFTEGLLSLSEWSEAKTKRAAWRKEVNDNEVLRDESKAAVDAIINKYRNGKTPKSIFESCCARDNEIYETCKNYFEVKQE